MGMFYKKNNLELVKGRKITHANFILSADEKEAGNFSHELPLDGWYYFEDEVSAYDFFGIDIPVTDTMTPEETYIDPKTTVTIGSILSDTYNAIISIPKKITDTLFNK